MGHTLGSYLGQTATARGPACHRGQRDAQAAEAGCGKVTGKDHFPIARLQSPLPREGKPTFGWQNVSRERRSCQVYCGSPGTRMDDQNFGHLPD